MGLSSSKSKTTSNTSQNTSETTAPMSGEKYAPDLKSEWNVVACASPRRRRATWPTAVRAA